MNVNKDIIEDYTNFLASTHDSIIGDVYEISSKIADKIAEKVCTFLEDKKHFEKCSIILPNQDDLKKKIEGTIRKYFLESIEDIEEFIKIQNSSIDECISGVAESLLIDLEHFSWESENNRHLLENGEMPVLPINEIVSSIITYINFRNDNNQEYHSHTTMIEDHVKDSVPVMLEQGKESFNDAKEDYKHHLNDKTYQLFSNIKQSNLTNNEEELGKQFK